MNLGKYSYSKSVVFDFVRVQFYCSQTWTSAPEILYTKSLIEFGVLNPNVYTKRLELRAQEAKLFWGLVQLVLTCFQIRIFGSPERVYQIVCWVRKQCEATFPMRISKKNSNFRELFGFRHGDTEVICSHIKFFLGEPRLCSFFTNVFIFQTWLDFLNEFNSFNSSELWPLYFCLSVFKQLSLG